MDIDCIQQEIHEIAIEKGFWEGDRNIAETLALVHSEVSEALECWRNGDPCDAYTISADGKPEGFPIEIADTIIRCLDLLETYKVSASDIIRLKLDYNKTRPYKHGKING